MREHNAKEFRQTLTLLAREAKREKLELYGIRPEALKLIFRDPFAFFIGVLASWGVTANVAWNVPFRLRECFGELSPQSIARMPYRKFEERVTKLSLHRFPWLVARFTRRAAQQICDQYGGEVRNIWATNSTVELKKRLRSFVGIGPKKEAMMLKMLAGYWGLRLDDFSQIHIAYDVHVRRVFLRTGLAKKDSLLEIERVGTLLSPSYPAKLDDAIWIVGRKFCHAASPDCRNCPLTGACAKKDVGGTKELGRGKYN